MPDEFGVRGPTWKPGALFGLVKDKEPREEWPLAYQEAYQQAQDLLFNTEPLELGASASQQEVAETEVEGEPADAQQWRDWANQEFAGEPPGRIQAASDAAVAALAQGRNQEGVAAAARQAASLFKAEPLEFEAPAQEDPHPDLARRTRRSGP